MKCVVQFSEKFGELLDTVARVSEDDAQAMVNSDKYAYCPKHVWKKYRKTEGKDNGQG